MIYLGLIPEQKQAVINTYCAEHDIEKVFILSPSKFYFASLFENTEIIEWNEIILYKFFYRLLQEINGKSLIVINECLRTQKRHDLTYNCIRHFLNQAKHQLIFQWLPFIDDMQDFMILYDFDTLSRWKHDKFDIDLLGNVQLNISQKSVGLNQIIVSTNDALKSAYQKEKDKLINSVGIKDPHTIPRNLYLMSGKARMQNVMMGKHYIGRNNRFKVESMQTYKTYKELSYPHEYTVFEFPHNFIDFSDFLTLSQQTKFDVLVADLKVDHWYFERYTQWTQRLNNGYANLS